MTVDVFLRLSQIIGKGNPIPVSRATWYAGIKAGRYPPGEKLGPRMRVWQKSKIDELVRNPPGA